jgi:hypothetical protein
VSTVGGDKCLPAYRSGSLFRLRVIEPTLHFDDAYLSSQEDGMLAPSHLRLQSHFSVLRRSDCSSVSTNRRRFSRNCSWIGSRASPSRRLRSCCAISASSSRMRFSSASRSRVFVVQHRRGAAYIAESLVSQGTGPVSGLPGRTGPCLCRPSLWLNGRLWQFHCPVVNLR